MTKLELLSGTGLWYALCILALLLTTGTLAAIPRSLQAIHGKPMRFIAAFNALLSIAVLVVLMDCAMYFENGSEKSDYKALDLVLFDQPWIFYVGVEALVTVLLVFTELNHARYRNSFLTVDAIRQTLNFLPEGIVVSDGNGFVRLSNLKMDALCRSLTGELLTDTNRFWSYLEEKQESRDGQFIVRTPDDHMWLFESELLTAHDLKYRHLKSFPRTYRQITARDVTERYRIIEELKEKNVRLQDIQRRMKAVSELSGDMFVEEEQQRARATLHNQLGQVLLMGRHYLEHPERTDANLVYMVTRQMNRFLLGEATGPREKAPGAMDELSEAIAMAGSIGVTVRLKGNAPTEAYIRGLLAQAVTECAANTVKHAEGDCVTVDIAESDEGVLLTLTNNGKPPKGRIAESGGLLSLRRKTEDMGGIMHVESSPAFVLTLVVSSGIVPEGFDEL
ncbi:MAG: hypothetical protein IKX10_09725 [Lachnospiraceae bacterium]|nr:hypothetical protein [Lachnospiraceae bacterium]